MLNFITIKEMKNKNLTPFVKEQLKSVEVYSNLKTDSETIDCYTVFEANYSRYIYSMSFTGEGFNQVIGDRHDPIKKGEHLGRKLKRVPKNLLNAVINRLRETELELINNRDLKHYA